LRVKGGAVVAQPGFEGVGGLKPGGGAGGGITEAEVQFLFGCGVLSSGCADCDAGKDQRPE
jgi:hypothetical protein